MEQLLPKNKVYLDEEVKKEYRTACISAKDNSCIDYGKHQNLLLVCYHCGDHNLYNNYSWNRCEHFQHFYCYYCFEYSLKKYNNICVDGSPIHHETKNVEQRLCDKIKFECRWSNCKKIFGGSTLKQHELSCELQRERECPVESCKWSGRLDIMLRDHFKEHENIKLLFQNFILNLESGITYFLMVLDKFVRVSYSSEQLGEVYEHNFDLEEVKEKLECARAVGLVSTNDVLLKKVEGKDAVKSLRKTVVIFVYFEGK